MSNINVCILSGNLVRDSELKYVGGNSTALCKFAIANNSYGGKDRDEVVGYFDLTMWGKRAESLTQYLTKGTGVIVECQARQERWTTDGGDKRSRITFNVSSLEFKGSRNGGQSQRQDDSTHDVYPDQSDEKPSGETAEFEDEIPF